MKQENYHLKNISNIIEKWCKKEKMLECYTEIKGGIIASNYNKYASIYIDNSPEWDSKYTRNQINDKGRELYRLISKYLYDNKIEQKLIIQPSQKRSWAWAGLEIYFLNSLHVSI